jgi:hypothetical protein
MKFICNKCNKEFKQKGPYMYHINKKYSCENNLLIDGKKVYKCDKCDKIYDNKTNYLYHDSKCKINKIIEDNIITPQNPHISTQNPHITLQNPQKLNNNIILNIDDNICNICNKKYSRIDSLKRHQIKCKIKHPNVIIDENDNIKKIINDLTNKIQNQDEEIIKLKNINNTIITTNNNTNNTNSHNNITNNINNTINYVNHGKENLNKLIKDEIKEILNSGYSCIYKSIMYTHYNDRLPEFKNIKYSDTKSSYCDVFIDGEWKKVKFETTIDELINKHFYEVSDMYHDNKNLIESDFKDGLIKDYTSDYYKFISYEEEDKYPDNWNKTMKREQQKKMRRRLNHNKDEVKGLIINKSLVDKKSSLKSIK